MTDVQVFKWFCKEQGIMANIRGMYYVCSPKRYSSRIRDNGVIKLTFEQWIHEIIATRGFKGILGRIVESYNCNSAYNRYDKNAVIIDGLVTDNFKKAIKHWNYFVSNNLMLDERCLKVGDIVSYKNPFLWNEETTEKIIIDNINIKDGYVSGHLLGTVGEDWKDKRDFMTLNSLRKTDNLKEELEMSYSVKRNRRIYNGANK